MLWDTNMIGEKSSRWPPNEWYIHTSYVRPQRRHLPILTYRQERGQ